MFAVCFALLLITSVGVVNLESDVDLEAYTTSLLNNFPPKDYNKNIRPKYGKEPLQVNVSLHINDISSISENSMSFDVDFDLRHYWNDDRLAFPGKNNITELVLEGSYAEKIWLPDTFFFNLKELKIHETFSSKPTTLLRVASNGDLIHETKVYMTAKCSMDLTYFPVDQQICYIDLSSYGKTTRDVIYNWLEDSAAIEFEEEINLPTFRLVGYNKDEWFGSERTGNYKSLILGIVVARNIAFYVARMYAPASLVVFISWIPFWLDRQDHHARVALGVTTVLTITTLITNSNEDLPKISHLTALDIYLFFCFLLVFLSLIEYATVGYYDDLVKRKEDARRCSENGGAEGAQNKEMEAKKAILSDTSMIDYTARRLFPISFLVFNVGYIVALYFIAVRNGHVKVQVHL